MKRLERILVLALVFMLAALGAVASAEALEVQDVRLDDGNELSVLLYGPANRGVNTYSATLDGQPLAVNSIESNADGTTWIFLLDTSTVSVNEGKEPIQALLGLGDNKGLIHEVGPNDNAAVIATGDTSGKYNLHTQISNLQSLATKLNSDPKNTQLNATIAAALNFLNTDRGVRRHKVMVIVAGEQSDNEAGMSFRELQDLASASQVTIYTVIFVTKNADAATRLGSLAESGCGGLQFTSKSTAGASRAAEIVKQIQDNEGLFSNLRLGVENAAGAQLTVATETGGLRLEDTVTLPQDVQGALQGGAGEPELITEPPVPEPGSKTLFGLSMPVLIGIAAGVLVIIALVIVLAVRSSKKKKEEDARRQAEIERQKAIDETVPDDPVPPAPAREVIQVTLAQVGSENSACYVAEMKEGELIVGRDPASVRLVVPNDPKISRKHMALHYENGIMTVENLSTINPTKVNDQRIDQPTTLHQRDMLTLGLTKLRITWWVKH